MRNCGWLLCLALVLAGCIDEGPGSDFEGDGLKDDIEDANENFQPDPGEANFLEPDTDGDGLCDGMPRMPRTTCTGCEDCNNNGAWEPCLGETDPLNDDTDNDGVADGADDAPVAGVGIDCSQGSPGLAYGDSLPPDKPFPGAEDGEGSS